LPDCNHFSPLNLYLLSFMVVQLFQSFPQAVQPVLPVSVVLHGEVEVDGGAETTVLRVLQVIDVKVERKTNI
jgi:hypothetical protein